MNINNVVKRWLDHVRLLRTTYYLQLLSYGLWVVFVLSTPENLLSLGALLYLLPISGVAIVTGLWHLVKRPDSRRLAALTIATPFGAFGVVVVAAQFGEMPLLSPELLLYTSIAAILFPLIFKPKSVAGFLPARLIMSRAFNRVLLYFLLLLVAGWVAISMTLLASGDGLEYPIETSSVAGTLLIVSIVNWLVSAIVVLPSILYGYLGLFRNSLPALRRLHYGQTGVAVVLLGTLVPVTFLLFAALVNPG